ncbi:uncharacterized protein LOC116604264 [Nematostella vectensis]|uniref:uncharacterized protein LOC116604264 n=1 Tax=Nematostella vectensis TaxID=45351 RepID=UPI0013904D1D|nr:uncharacterized protein LOC116604264 [Nematostella vectensis]
MNQLVKVSCIVLVSLAWCSATDQKDETLKRYDINGGDWKEAQSVINKLVDESIAKKVTEAEKDMANLLEQNIVEHIKRKGSFLSAVKKACKDKLTHCDTLAEAGVCKSSRKAMKEHCPKTCNLCETEYVKISPEVEIVMKPKGKADANSAKKSVTGVASEVLKNLFTDSSVSELHSIEPLLGKQSKDAMKFHDNDMSDEEKKISDAKQLLEDAKSLKRAPKKKPEKEVQANTKSKIAKKGQKQASLKKADKLKGIPIEKLSKTITYKNKKYKVTPIVDWKKISKMLKSLGYKAIHILGAHNKHLAKGLKKHLKDNGVSTKVKTSAHVAEDTVVKASHREKSWRNKVWFKANCHPMCLVSCVGSCGTGCCKEHDANLLKKGRPSYCHEMCLANCVPSCGSGCCSAEDEKKRGHLALHWSHKDAPKQDTATKKPAKPADSKPAKKPVKPVMIGKKGSSRGVNMGLSSPEMYLPQIRQCIAPCPQVCAPACSDICCGFGAYAPNPDTHVHPGLQPNVPYPNKNIPGEAYVCKEECKFSCDLDCPENCCGPEGLMQRNQRLQINPAAPYDPMPPPQTGFPSFAAPVQTFQATDGTCPAPCPGSCSPDCTVACCAAQLGLPQADDNAVARSSTRKVIHLTHVIRPFQQGNINAARTCAITCGTHCTPACARSGCCDTLKK